MTCRLVLFPKGIQQLFHLWGAQQLLKLSGYREVYARDKRDALILYTLIRGQSVLETNELLFSQGMATLGPPAG